MYIKRHMEETVTKTEKMFGAVMVTGPRQAGKTTLTDDVDMKLDEADKMASSSNVRYTHDEVFEGIRGKLDGQRQKL